MKPLTKTILWSLLLTFLGLAACGSFFLWKLNQTEKKITTHEENFSILDTLKNFSETQEISLRGAKTDRINILLLGIAGENKPGQFLTDTIMIASLNLKTKQVALLSVPRDLWAKVPDFNFESKINTFYGYGLRQHPQDHERALEPLEKTLENVTSLSIDYWIVANFDGFEELVDAIGGINITNERDIYDPRYPGPNYSYETFELEKGFQHLDGATALKYARMRHNDPEGDFGRAKRQQQVLQSVRNKVFSIGTLTNAAALNKILNALGNNIRTNMAARDLNDFLVLIKNIDTDNINNVVLDAWNKDSLLKVSHVDLNGVHAFILVPRVGNWSEVHDAAQNIFDANARKIRRENISAENARVALIDGSGENIVAGRIKKLLTDNFDYKNVIALSNQKKNLAEKTMVYDLTKGKVPFTLDELTKKIPAASEYSLPKDYSSLLSNIQTDLVVVIGKDIISRYNMDEVSIEEYQANSQ